MPETIALLSRGAMAALAFAVAVSLQGCGGGSPPDQSQPERLEMTGLVLGGSTTPTSVAQLPAAKGTSGSLRTAQFGNSLGYRVSLVGLAAPYAVRADFERGGEDSVPLRLVTVAAEPGLANVTLLTSLLVAQLFGQDPESAFDAFDAAATQQLSAASLADAHAEVSAFLQRELNVTVQPTAGDFVTAPFDAMEGDPMYDTIAAVANAIAQQGLTFKQLTDRVARAARLCLTEKITITVAGRATAFCPETKSATPREGDTTLLDYVFLNTAADRLTVEVRGDSVLNARLETTNGASFGCSGAGCGAIALGVPDGELVRTVAFNGLVLQGASGSAGLTGTLAGAIPGIVLPVLDCNDNRYILVFDDRSVVGACAELDPFGFGTGLAFLQGFPFGADPQRVTYNYSESFAAASPNPNRPVVSLVTDSNDTLLAVEFQDFEEGSSTPRRRFVCFGDDCNGVNLGPLTEDTDFGLFLRTIVFDDTVLTRLNDDGTLSDERATLKASLGTAYAPAFFVPPYPTGACDPGGTSIPVTAASGLFNTCLSSFGFQSEPAPGQIELSTMEEGNADIFRIVLEDGVLQSAQLALNRFDFGATSFSCSGGCPGITVSAPGPGGERTVSFDNALLGEVFFFGNPRTGPRSITLTSGSYVFSGN